MVMHDAGGRFNAWLNPLTMLEADPLYASQHHPPTLESVLEFLCAIGLASDLASLVERYGKINSSEHRIFVAPNEPKILDKLVWPLRHAKAGYMLGNYLGTIALCGLVSEMAAVLLFDANRLEIGGAAGSREMTEKDQRRLFGSRFEDLGQQRRVDVLRAFGIIDGDLAELLNQVRGTRRKYLHLLSEGGARVAEDAAQTFNRTVTIVARTLGQELEEGKVKLRPEILRYLVAKGAATVGQPEQQE